MKTVFVLITVISFMVSCQKRDNSSVKSSFITIIIDETDPHALKPKPVPILRLFNFEEDNNRAAGFRIGIISDKRLNSAYEYSIPDGFAMDTRSDSREPHYREKLIMAFYDTFKVNLQRLYYADTVASLGYSECFHTICDELHLLVRRKCDNKTLIVYSDLQENSKLYNCYLPQNQNSLRALPQKAAQQFNEIHPLPNDLNGITVVFAYKPTTRVEDQRFATILPVYKLLLTQRGAKVRVQAENYFSP